jgi:hypothetical protein
MLGRKKHAFLPWEEIGILVGNKLKGEIGNIENYMDYHIIKLARLFVHYSCAVYP